MVGEFGLFKSFFKAKHLPHKGLNRDYVDVQGNHNNNYNTSRNFLSKQLKIFPANPAVIYLF